MNNRDQNDRDRRARDIFLRAVEIPSSDARAAYVEGACQEDASLRSRVQALLENLRQDSFLESPAVDCPSAAITETAISEVSGSVIGRYKLLQKLGEGGFGVVYMAEQQKPMVRRVALKIIKPGMDTRQVIARFEAERQALAIMDHPHVAKVLDAGATDTGRSYFVMELIRGVPITRFCEDRQLAIKERLELFVLVCQAIQHAHQKGVIHRDIKPSNILVTLNDGIPHPVVIDFGVAKAIDQRLTEKTLYTRFGHMIGTPAYMSPEQAEMSKQDVDTRTDVYSLGVVLYELLTGDPPFPEKRLREAGYAEIQRIISQEEPMRPSMAISRLNSCTRAVAANRNCEPAVLLKLIKGDLDWIVLKAIEKDRTRRYETANGLAMDIRRHLNDELVVARPPSSTYRFRKLVRRNRLTFAATGAVAIALLLGAIISTWQAMRATRAHQQTVAALAKARQSEHRAKAEALAAQRNLYVSDLHLAQQALEASNTGRARILLWRHIPTPDRAEGTNDLRGWEWRYLWDQLQSGKPEIFATLGGAVFGLDVSPDGRYLAASTTSGQLNLWELHSGKEIAAIEPGNGMPTKPVFFPDSSRLVYHYWTEQSTDGLLKIWDMQMQKVSREIPYPNRQVGPKTVGPNGHRILFGTMPDKIRLFDLRTGLARWEIQTSPDRTMHTSDTFLFAEPDGREWVLGDANGDIRVFDVETGQPITDWNAQSGPFTALKMSRDGRLLASAGSSITVWDYRTHEQLGKLTGHQNWVSDLEFSSDGSRLVSSSADQTVRLWDLKAFTELATFRGADQEVWEVEFLSDDRTIFASAKNGKIYVWDSTDRPRKDSPVVADGVERFALSRFGDRLAALETDGSVKTGEIGDDTALAAAHYAGTDNSFVSLSPDGNQLIVGKTNGGIAVYSIVTGELLHLNHDHRAPITGAHMLASGGLILSSDQDRELLLHKIGDPKPEVLWNEEMEDWEPFISSQKFAVSPDERTVAAGSFVGRITFWDLPTGREIGSFQNPSPQPIIYGLAFSPDGQTLATADVYGSVKLWAAAEARRAVSLGDKANLQPVTDLQGHRSAAWALTFSPDGKRLVSGGDGTDAVIIWDLATHQELLRLPLEGGVSQLAFSHDGIRLFALNGRTLYTWRAPP